MNSIPIRLSLSLSVVILVGCGSPNSADPPNQNMPKLPEDSWKTVKMTDLPKDDRDLWTKYHADHAPGEASVDNECFKRNGRFKSQIRKVRNRLEERILYDNNGSVKYVFGPQIVTSPFVIWTAPSGPAKDIDSGNFYDVEGQSLTIEKMETVAYQYICHKGKMIMIQTTD